MTETSDKNTHGDPSPETDGLNPELAAAVDSVQGEGAEAQAAIDPLEALRAENTELNDRMLRLAADMENLRRRTEREVKDARTFAISNFARDMLTVSDDLARALQVVRDNQHADNFETALAGLIEGIAATERSMHNALNRHGVTKVEPKGERFDPNFHQAMFEVPNPDVPNNTVMEVVQAGYKIGERVLRPAMVGVAKGGPKPDTTSGA